MTLSELKGIGEKREAQLNKLGLHSVTDVLFDFPRRYIDRTKLTDLVFTVPDGEVTIRARVIRKTQSRSTLYMEVLVELAKIKIVYFHAPFVGKNFHLDEEYYFHGVVKDRTMYNPVFASAFDDGFLRIVPVYRLTKGMGQAFAEKLHRDVLLKALEQDTILENLPQSVMEKYGLMPRKLALQELHMPSAFDALEDAKRRITFEELYTLYYRIHQSIAKREHVSPLRITKGMVNCCLSYLPFEMTPSQMKAVEDIVRDLTSGKVMNRLIHGDVGSGKSAIGYVAAWLLVQNRKQVLFMAPTTVLAKQLYQGYVGAFGAEGVGYLSSDVKGKGRASLLDKVKCGDCEILFSTHSALSEDVVFESLGLVITDEQQRFGVRQREIALGKAFTKHNLYLTATPIPRTLAMTLLGNMDTTLVSDLPKGRKPIKTYFVDQSRSDDMISFIQKQIDMGKQAYFVVPTIEDGYANLKAVFKRLTIRLSARIGRVHGAMKSEDVASVMQAFQNGTYDVLVSTTLIEVGIDNPNATIMVILESDKFGLSQLHQLRGRVGRGKEQSYCFLMSSRGKPDRLDILIKSNNGMEIAEADLKLRGPGSFFGEEQSGKIVSSFPFTEEELLMAWNAGKEGASTL